MPAQQARFEALDDNVRAGCKCVRAVLHVPRVRARPP